MQEAHIVAPKLEVPSILKGIKPIRMPTRAPKYYKRKIKQMKKGLF